MKRWESQREGSGGKKKDQMALLAAAVVLLRAEQRAEAALLLTGWMLDGCWTLAALRAGFLGSREQVRSYSSAKSTATEPNRQDRGHRAAISRPSRLVASQASRRI